MITRYCGQLKIDLGCDGLFKGRLKFSGRITTSRGDPWEFNDVLVDFEDLDTVDSGTRDEKAFDIAAVGAIHFGSMYGPGYDPETDGGEVPDWAPAPWLAQQINDNVMVADQGYCIRRSNDGPTTYIG